MVISGVVLLYEQEIDRVVHPGCTGTTSADRSPTPRRSRWSAARRPRSSRPTSSTATASTCVYDDATPKQAYVDPGAGRLLGVDDTTDGVMGFLYNLHLCGLSCKGYAGYLPFLESRRTSSATTSSPSAA